MDSISPFKGLVNKWVKRMEAENELKVIKLTDDDYMEVVESAVANGHPVLLENIGETQSAIMTCVLYSFLSVYKSNTFVLLLLPGEIIDSDLHPILERKLVKRQGVMCISCGDKMLTYNENFRLYITTFMENPHYQPETIVLVALLDCTVTDEGLKDQLLATVVAQERPDLQEKKEKLIVESAKNRDALYTLETKILEVLSSSEGNILEDENAINILSSSKTLSEEIQAKQLVAVSTEKEIDQARQRYMPVAQYASVLYFCINEFGQVCPMYEYSLQWFLDLFVHTIMNTPKEEDLKQRLDKLNTFFTRSIYANLCRSLYDRDKMIFSFILCMGVLRSQVGVSLIH